MKNKSILDELLEYRPTKSTELVLRNRAENAVAACVNLMNVIEELFEEDVANDLTNRLLLSVKNRDPARFLRKIDSIIQENNK